MPSLLIRDLDDALHRRLKARARAHRRSLAVEARETLRRAIARDDTAPEAESLLQIATRLFGPEHGVELDLPLRSGELSRLPPDFSGPTFDP
jgi:plasmid stability protein